MSDSNDARTALIGALRKQAKINDPFLGPASPSEFEEKSKLWPGDQWSHVDLKHVTEAEGRRVEEYRFRSKTGPEPYLPAAFVFDPAAPGGPTAYVYSDHHLVEDRAPIHTPVEGIHPWRTKDDVLFFYFAALNGNHLEDVLDVFEKDAYFHHSNAETFTGRDELRQDFSKMMGDSGIRIKYCRFTDDGTTNVVECYMPSGRPAIAAYERGAPGQLRAVRIYL